MVWSWFDVRSFFLLESLVPHSGQLFGNSQWEVRWFLGCVFGKKSIKCFYLSAGYDTIIKSGSVFKRYLIQSRLSTHRQTAPRGVKGLIFCWPSKMDNPLSKNQSLSKCWSQYRKNCSWCHPQIFHADPPKNNLPQQAILIWGERGNLSENHRSLPGSNTVCKRL